MPSKKQPSGYAQGQHPNSLKNLQKRGDPPVHRAEVGNRSAVTHGGHENPHRARLDAKVREVFDALAADAPVRALDGSLPRHDAPMVTLLAVVLCRLENVGTYLADYGWKDAKTKQPREGVLSLETKLRREAAEYLDSLGMTPKSRARLGVDLVRARDLAQEWSNTEHSTEPDVIEGTASDA